MSLPPWASGPAEILLHGLSLLQKDSDANRRLAMLAIDNAVEPTIKTYLGLPKRVTKIGLSRADVSEISESFPRMLDALEHHAAERIVGIDLGEIEWYHRLRNHLYHQGNGLTVEREKVDVYAQLAKVLFKNLFENDLPVREESRTDILGAFMSAWVSLERVIYQIAAQQERLEYPTSRALSSPLLQISALEKNGILQPSIVAEINELQVVRNQVVHGRGDYETLVDPAVVGRIKRITQDLEKKLDYFRLKRRREK